jgi:hypothetical protein
MTDIIGSVLGSTIEGAFGNAERRTSDRRQRRRMVAEGYLEWMTPMLGELRHLRERRNPSFWIAAIPAAYESLDRGQSSTPFTWRHLKRSIRFALGEGVGGLASLDHFDESANERIDYDPLWSMFAADYVELCTRRVQAWSDAWSERTARRVAIPDYDAWLRATDRWHPGTL